MLEVSMFFLISIVFYIKKIDFFVEVKFKGFVEWRWNNSLKVLDSFDNWEKLIVMIEVWKVEFFGKLCMVLNVFWVFL